jgi:hypothetical protein
VIGNMVCISLGLRFGGWRHFCWRWPGEMVLS